VSAHEGHHDHDHEHHIHEEAKHTTKSSSQDAHKHDDHSHHDHDHKHEQREMPAEYNLDTLFPAHINKNDVHVKFVMFACKITRAHLFVKLFDDLMKPLPRTA